MRDETYQKLREINNRFYDEHAYSFSETRKSAWTGWESCASHIEAQLGLEKLRVLDLAGGNLRFEKFLLMRFPETVWELYAVDNAIKLVPDLDGVRVQYLDILEALSSGKNLNEQIEAPLVDIAVSFGFMHHIPSFEHRAAVLQSLVDACKAGSLIFVSFWQFLSNPKMRAKAEITHARGLQEFDLPDLNENDFLLGWKHDKSIYRYCHNFEQAEIDELAALVSSQTEYLDSFVADGKDNAMNNYLVLKKR